MNESDLVESIQYYCHLSKQYIRDIYIYELSSRYNGITLSNIKPLIVF